MRAHGQQLLLIVRQARLVGQVVQLVDYGGQLLYRIGLGSHKLSCRVEGLLQRRQGIVEQLHLGAKGIDPLGQG